MFKSLVEAVLLYKPKKDPAPPTTLVQFANKLLVIVMLAYVLVITPLLFTKWVSPDVAVVLIFVKVLLVIISEPEDTAVFALL